MSLELLIGLLNTVLLLVLVIVKFASDNTVSRLLKMVEAYAIRSGVPLAGEKSKNGSYRVRPDGLIETNDGRIITASGIQVNPDTLEPQEPEHG